MDQTHTATLGSFMGLHPGDVADTKAAERRRHSRAQRPGRKGWKGSQAWDLIKIPMPERIIDGFSSGARVELGGEEGDCGAGGNRDRMP